MLGKKSKRRFRETRMGAPRIPPALFDGAAVGLRIVAAMGGAGPVDPARPKARSDPIPIRGSVGPAAPLKPARDEDEEEEEEGEEDDVELSESYTCVISRVGGQTVRKRVYLDDDDDADGSGGIGGKFEMNSGVFFESPPAALGPIPADFLSSCYLCRKKLHGLDIFMYRGDKAFCSAECRCQQMLSDERREKCRSEAGKPRGSSVSPYRPPPLPFDAGVVAA